MTVKRYDAESWRASPLARRHLDFSDETDERKYVMYICSRVQAEGDEALREFTNVHDGWAPGPDESFELPKSELAAAASALPKADREALEFAARRIREFHEHQMPLPSVESPGLKLVSRPVRRAGIYAPGGRAVYPSTVLMTAIPARVAGVAEVVLATPSRSDGGVPAAILAAAHVAGVDAVFRMGGAHAIAALAFGTASVPRVDVIAGPGNIWVTLAKKEVFGFVGVDGIAGPTEIAVIADSSARPDYVAADLAAQLEHDPRAIAVLFTDSAALAARVEEEFANLVQGLERAKIIARASCSLVVVDSLATATQLADDFAPEHLLVVAHDQDRIAAGIHNAGAIFIGPYATVPLGDYAAGPNHTLPTSGAARFASPLGVHTFLKRTSVLSLDRDDLIELRDATVRLAELEGLGGHAHAVEVRLE